MCSQTDMREGTPNRRRPFLLCLVLAGAVAADAGDCLGSSPAFDSAADHAYDFKPGFPKAWLQGSNGGFGWGSPWMSGSTLPGDPIGHIGSSATNGNGDLDNDGDINTPRSANGRAWELFGPNPVLGGEGSGGANVRVFQGPLQIGQIFSIDFDNGVQINPAFPDGERPFPSLTSWSVLSPDSAGDEFGLQARGDKPNYVVEGGIRLFDSGIPLTTEGLHCELMLLPPPNQFTPPAWIMTVTPLAPGSKTYTFTGFRSGPQLAPADRLIVAGTNTGLDPANADYFNNISITGVPEPGSAAVLMAGAALLLRRRR